MIAGFDAKLVSSADTPLTIGNVPSGMEALLLADMARAGTSVAYVMSDGQRVADLEQILGFVAPDIPVMTLPAWDCLPYDRVSPSADTSARRLAALSGLISHAKKPHPAIVLVTVNAMLQKMAPRDIIESLGFSARPGNHIRMEDIAARLERNGFDRVATVREVGEFAVRGGILDVFVPGTEEPVRLDFFGDTLESIRTFDPASQRTIGQARSLDLNPMSEVTLTPDTISRFRKNYLSLFGAATRDDALYQAVSEGRRYAGMEHWLPLFYEQLETAFDYLKDFRIVTDHTAREAAKERSKLVLDYYDARRSSGETKGSTQGAPYKPVSPGQLYLDGKSFDAALAAVNAVRLTPFNEQDSEGRPVATLDAHVGPRWARPPTEGESEERVNVFDLAVKHIAERRAKGWKVLITGWSEGSLDRLLQVLNEHGLEKIKPVTSLKEVEKLGKGEAASAVLSLEAGFETGTLAVIGEQDILGDRMVRRSKRRKRGADFISEVAGLDEGSLVVHAEHGIGRFVGLRTIEAAGAPRACLELHYADDAKLFLPVENIDLLSRYGSDAAEAQLDKLGGGAWQMRKAKLKKRLLDMADELIRIAAARLVRHAPALVAPDGLYDEFAARFPYDETEDQLNAIEAVREDLGAGRPMDRLICGDVGFGKTEVALRAAFLAAMNGVQVAVVVPTTLLSRQHFRTFSERFRGLPIRVQQASRLVGSKELTLTKKEVADGKTDIVVGTHALLGAGISFANLGLLIIDEEQHFGVKHKERLKELKSDVHVLTLSATPIPRTLQLAMTGVRELSLITTPPVDRMAVRTFISPFDPLVIRETLMREHYRGGQSFYVCPRLADLADIHAFLQSDVPELKVAVAHGQMPAGELEDIMNAFYDGKYDVLLSTTIVESGLDVPTANTLIVHRADMFGLAQLYQLRGRVGRSKVRAFALFTLPVNKVLTTMAERRLKVLQSLDTLGAGFQLASHDLDIRGAGNLLGEEQSGHIKEVGFELYQQMLEEAVAEVKGDEQVQDSGWSPQISVGTSVMIPEDYVPDLHLRMGLYRRLGELADISEIDGFGAEMIDRFGPLPKEVQHLLKIVYIKSLCRTANVEKVDAGPKGVVVQFRNKEFPNPAALVAYIGKQGTMAKIRPDHSLFLTRDLPTPEKRLTGAAMIMTQLAELARS
ncbi:MULTISPECIES: transcription-repair coupling factor [unclassified Agrobacterium]|uniref:transcription-repair coupling factor n=1 Tax=unclassified Agrobacterium TaxID=2632611 RepID=UPI00244CCFF0|nr:MULTISPECIES: transcription-repair coupling factor [unclassified Agrobacterium]MDH0613490.1 transcription-repair coupling factor [Agrobacterium sp. GD03872]MDH0697407.1 transcription-repair coupling factor [Agrobacterium sp. GD03871]MDH1059691.1 transcription-repair coupling factor [Agrobacterium sp. GD03992]MDH2211514.1 transcription-repair coupling factor [Agrobacterium sp. GD03643]MDH2220773.1 transcription-repair coupling factor [Agrobacterium sp. GD03638]